MKMCEIRGRQTSETGIGNGAVKRPVNETGLADMVHPRVDLSEPWKNI